MTPERLADIERRARRFEGVPPAVVGETVQRFWLNVRQTTAPGAGGTLALDPKPINAALALAQIDVPALLEEVERLRSAIADIAMHVHVQEHGGNTTDRPLADCRKWVCGLAHGALEGGA